MLCKIVGVFILAVPICLCGQESAGAVGEAQPKDLYWIVAPNDKILVRSRPGGEEHALTGKYPVLRPNDWVFCKGPVGPAASKSKAAPKKPEECALSFITADDTETQKLTDKIPPNRWVKLSLIEGGQEPPRIVPPSGDL